MATKTITLESDAYERLKNAKRHAKESFSCVVRRAEFPVLAAGTGGAILEAVSRLAPVMDEKALNALAESQREDYERPSMSVSAWDIES